MPAVFFNVYNLNTLPRDFHWMISNKPHIDMIKLIFPMVIPRYVSNLLVIDPNIFCISDVDIFRDYDTSHQIQILSNSDKSVKIWIINVQSLNTSHAYKNFLDNISTYKIETENIEPDFFDLKIYQSTVNQLIRCAPINKSTKNAVENYVMKVNAEFIPELHYCMDTSYHETIQKRNIKECEEFPQFNIKNYKYRTLLFLREFTFITDETDITMMDWSDQRFHLYRRRTTVCSFKFINQSKQLNKRYDIAYHVILKNGDYRPINTLRNIALKNVNTPYVLLNDVDFVPAFNLYTVLKSQIKGMKTMKKKALVIPAFCANENVAIPENINQLIQMWNKNQVAPFNKNSFPKGHGPTNYSKYKTAVKPYTVQYKPNYEPYVVVQSLVPKYDERFVGYGYNKIQHILELDAAAFEFIVIPKTFLVHKYHKISSESLIWRKLKNYRSFLVSIIIYNINKLIKKFQWMAKNYVSKDFLNLIFPALIPNKVNKLVVIDPNLVCLNDVNSLINFHFEDFTQIKVLLTNDKSLSIWLVNVQNLKSSSAYQYFIDNISTRRKYAKDFKLESLNLIIDRTTISSNESCARVRRNDSTATENYLINLNRKLIPELPYCINTNFVDFVRKRNIKACKKIPQVDDQNFKYCTLLFVRKFVFNSEENDVTLVTQMTFNKFSVFEDVCRRWTGPISVALYLEEEQLLTTLNYINQSRQLNQRYNIAFHVLFKNGEYQPINRLRNIALKHVNTPYVLLNDVDFVPSLNLYTTIKNHIKSTQNMKKKALVIPAFSANYLNVSIPLDFHQLSQMWKGGIILPFHQNFFPKGHRSTDYEKLKTANEPYTIKWEPNYEPYVVVENSVPEYDERFVGYIWNKIQHIVELDAAGYEFIVLPKTFLVHKYHNRSTDFQSYLNSGYYYPCMLNLKNIFLNELNHKYNCGYTYESFH
ncbi:hypothetical protein FQR65_LT04545 [Abscondita terminalis]|nr:hypothetical protein FQR65_LT04545 [Abscondita terminalis]